MLANKLNAMLYLLEHKFYEKSQLQPFLNMTNYGNLKYLPSRRALADMASFFEAENAEELPAWAHQLYPDHVYGVLASSAPIQAQVDFYQYLQVVVHVFNQTSPTCAQNIHSGFVELHKLMKTSAGRRDVKSAMHICENIDPKNRDKMRMLWHAMIEKNFENVVQWRCHERHMTSWLYHYIYL